MDQTTSEASFRDEDGHISKYLGLSLEKGSQLYQDLMNRASKEYDEKGRISLSDYLGTCPQGLTPQMRAWYSQNIEPYRVEALQATSSTFKQIQVNGVSGVWTQAELDSVERKRLTDKHECIRKFHEAKQRDHRELQAASDAYEQMHLEYNREPKIYNLYIYYTALVLIGLCEMLLNTESLLKLPLINSPALAGGAAIILATGIGCAGHIHGILLGSRLLQSQNARSAARATADRKLAASLS